MNTNKELTFPVITVVTVDPQFNKIYNKQITLQKIQYTQPKMLIIEGFKEKAITEV